MSIGQEICDFFAFLVNFIFAYFQSLGDLIVRRKKDVRGKVIVITGSAGGLGCTVARMLASKGAKLALLDVCQVPNEQLANEICAAGSIARAFVCDVTKPDDLNKVARAIHDNEDLGDVDVLLCNAGVLTVKWLSDLSEMDIRRTFDINILGYFWTIRAFLPRMLERNQGHIAAISSVAGHYGNSMGTDYHASKFAVRGLMESLEWELYDKRKTGIKVTTIYPYFTRTPLIKDCDISSRFPLMEPEETACGIVNAILREDNEAWVPSYMEFFCRVIKNLVTTRSKAVIREYFNVRYVKMIR